MTCIFGYQSLSARRAINGVGFSREVGEVGDVQPRCHCRAPWSQHKF